MPALLALGNRNALRFSIPYLRSTLTLTLTLTVTLNPKP